MEQDIVVERFEELRERYDELHRPGTWLDLKDELGLGGGPFNDRLTTAEIQDLNHAMEERITQCPGTGSS